MRDILVSIFGENGAGTAQVLISLIIFIVLIGAVVWLVRRYAIGGSTSTPRGRLPRLAVVDALTVDNRRRLLLVRRDNVEHLVMVGGPTDIVVEPSIVRTRVAQRPGQPSSARTPAQPATNAPQPAPPPPPERTAAQKTPRGSAIRTARPQSGGSDTPIPFPPRRAQVRQAAREPNREPGREPQRESSSSSGPTAQPAPRPEPEAKPLAGPVAALEAPPVEDETAREMQRVEAAVVEMTGATAPPPAPQLAGTAPQLARPTPQPAQPAATPAQPVPRTVQDESSFAPPARTAAAAASPFAPAPADRPDAGDHPAEPVAEEPNRPPPRVSASGEENDGPSSVGDLEKDMARLLGQISTERSA